MNLHFERVYRTQGSVMTGTNIRVHSDFDLVIDLKSKGMVRFYPGSFFPGPLILSDFDSSWYTIIPGEVVLFNTDVDWVKPGLIVFIYPIQHYTHTRNTHHTKVVLGFLKKP